MPNYFQNRYKKQMNYPAAEQRGIKTATAHANCAAERRGTNPK